MLEINLDITYRCTLECPKCTRQYYKDLGLKVPGHDMTISEFKKIIAKFKVVRFCGNISDPVFNPNFISFLKMCYEKNVICKVHHAATGKSLAWYKEAFAANPDAKWIFGIDGLPEDSHIYRKNQNGKKLFETMLLCKEMGLNTIWKHIIFRYNENTMEEAKRLAEKHQIEFYFVKSGTYNDGEDELRPINRENYVIR